MKTETKRKAARGTSRQPQGNGTQAQTISGRYAPPEDALCQPETTLTPQQTLELYRYLMLTRLVEERIVTLYRQTKVVGGVFRSLGQEATADGAAYALRPEDFITPVIRDLGSVFVRVILPRQIFAKCMAIAWGPSGGKALIVHFGGFGE